MSEKGASAIVFRYVEPARLVRLNDRLSRLSTAAFWTLVGGFLLYWLFNTGGRYGAGNREPIAAWIGIEWLLPYPRLLPIAIMVGSLLFGTFKLGLSMMANSAERRIDRDGTR